LSLQRRVATAGEPATQIPQATAFEPQHRATLTHEDRPRGIHRGGGQRRQRRDRARLIDEHHGVGHIVGAQRGFGPNEQHFGAARQRDRVTQRDVLALTEEARGTVLPGLKTTGGRPHGVVRDTYIAIRYPHGIEHRDFSTIDRLVGEVEILTCRVRGEHRVVAERGGNQCGIGHRGIPLVLPRQHLGSSRQCGVEERGIVLRAREGDGPREEALRADKVLRTGQLRPTVNGGLTHVFAKEPVGKAGVEIGANGERVGFEPSPQYRPHAYQSILRHPAGGLHAGPIAVHVFGANHAGGELTFGGEVPRMLDFECGERTAGEIRADGVGEIAAHAVHQRGHGRSVVQVVIEQRTGIGHREVAAAQNHAGGDRYADRASGFREECRHQKFVLTLKRNVR